MCLEGTFNVIAIVDVTGTSFRHAMKAPFSSIRKGLRFVEGGVPVKIEGVHVLNTKSFILKIIGDVLLNFNCINVFIIKSFYF